MVFLRNLSSFQGKQASASPWLQPLQLLLYWLKKNLTTLLTRVYYHYYYLEG